MGRWYLQHTREAAQPSLFVAWESANETADGNTHGDGLVLFVNPELHHLRGLVDTARTRLAALEAEFTVEKAKVGALKARLFSRLREHFQKRDRLRLVVSYRRKFLETLVRVGDEEAEKIAENQREAEAQNEREYSETAKAMADRKELAPEETAELGRLWRKLVKLFHPDRFANDPVQQATYEKLTAAINLAKDNGDLATLRRIADDPQGFILRQGWTALNFGDTEQVGPLRKLWESIELEIVRVLEALNALKESPDYELHRLTMRNPEFFADTVRRHIASLDVEIARLVGEAAELEREIAELAE